MVTMFYCVLGSIRTRNMSMFRVHIKGTLTLLRYREGRAWHCLQHRRLLGLADLQVRPSIGIVSSPHI
jgi:hypothetical protein